jgi:hypothetical protein
LCFHAALDRSKSAMKGARRGDSVNRPGSRLVLAGACWLRTQDADTIRPRTPNRGNALLLSGIRR